MFGKEKDTNLSIGRSGCAEITVRENCTDVKSGTVAMSRFFVTREKLLASLSPYIGGRKLAELTEALDLEINTQRPTPKVKINWPDGHTYIITENKISGKPELMLQEDAGVYVRIRNILKDVMDEKDIVDFINDITGKNMNRRRAEEEDVKKIIKATPQFMPNGFTLSKNYSNDDHFAIVDRYENVFVWVPERLLKSGARVRGFYISKFEISRGHMDYPLSCEGQEPWTDISYLEAKLVAERFGGRLISNEQYNSICEYAAEKVGEDAVYKDSTSIGKYYNYELMRENRALDHKVGEIKKPHTGGYEICGVSGLAGGVWCLTDSVCRKSDSKGMISARGGSYFNDGTYNMSSECAKSPDIGEPDTGFRIVLG